ncbi:MAG: hypothetical protein U0792_22955 [Gemmataceae bacterium]
MLRAKDNLKDAAITRIALQMWPNVAMIHGNLGAGALQQEGTSTRPSSAISRLSPDSKSSRFESYLGPPGGERLSRAALPPGTGAKSTSPRGTTPVWQLHASRVIPQGAIAASSKPEAEAGLADAFSNLGGAYAELGDMEGHPLLPRSPALRSGIRWCIVRDGDSRTRQDATEDIKKMEEFLGREHHRLELLHLHHGLAHHYDAKKEYAIWPNTPPRATHCKEIRIRQGITRDDRLRHLSDEAVQPSFFERVKGWGLRHRSAGVRLRGMPTWTTRRTDPGEPPAIFGAGELTRRTHSTRSRSDEQAGRRRQHPELTQEVVQMRDTCRGFARTTPRRTASWTRCLITTCGSFAAIFPKASSSTRSGLHDVAVSCWITNFKQIRWASDCTDPQPHAADGSLAEGAAGFEVKYEETVDDSKAWPQDVEFVGVEDWRVWRSTRASELLARRA